MKRLIRVLIFVLILTVPIWALSELKHTVKPSGGDFTSLGAAVDHLEAAHSNLVTADVYATIEIDGDWSAGADTAAVVIHNITTDATHYISIYTTVACRHSGIWNTARYILSVSKTYAINSLVDFLYLDGLQVAVQTVDSANAHAMLFYRASYGTGARHDVSNCIWRGAKSATYAQQGISSYVTNLNVWNCIGYDIATGTSINDSAIAILGGTTINIYSSTFIGGYRNVRQGAGTVTCKNVYSGGSGSADFYGTITMTNCGSEDGTATGDGEVTCAVNTDTFVNVTAGSEDFHLAADGLSPLQGTGIDTSGEGAPLNYTTDIDAQTRDATWDIGADAWYIAATGMINNTLIIIGKAMGIL